MMQKARVFAEEIEKIVENKFDAEKDIFASLNSVEKIDFKIELLKAAIDTKFAEAKSVYVQNLTSWLYGL